MTILEITLSPALQTSFLNLTTKSKRNKWRIPELISYVSLNVYWIEKYTLLVVEKRIALFTDRSERHVSEAVDRKWSSK